MTPLAGSVGDTDSSKVVDIKFGQVTKQSTYRIQFLFESIYRGDSRPSLKNPRTNSQVALEACEFICIHASSGLLRLVQLVGAALST